MDVTNASDGTCASSSVVSSPVMVNIDCLPKAPPSSEGTCASSSVKMNSVVSSPLPPVMINIDCLPKAPQSSEGACASSSVKIDYSFPGIFNETLVPDDISITSSRPIYPQSESKSTPEPRAAPEFPEARHGVKRRWTEDEVLIFKRAFRPDIENKYMPTGIRLKEVQNELNSRSVAQIQTRLNNILLGKQK